jgi:hypothetical protein
MSGKAWQLSSDPRAMIVSLMDKGSKGRSRKLRLFAVACCRRHPQILACDRCREKLETAERFADGLATNAERRRVAEGHCNHTAESGQARWCSAAAPVVTASAMDAAEFTSANVAYYAIEGIPQAIDGKLNPEWRRVYDREREAQVPLLRCIFGNPFRPVMFSPAWRTDTAVALARQMYEGRDFGAMPILADALQDAGCDSEDVLGHCRDPGPHVRGCWVADLVLGRE